MSGPADGPVTELRREMTHRLVGPGNDDAVQVGRMRDDQAFLGAAKGQFGETFWLLHWSSIWVVTCQSRFGYLV